MVSSLGSAKGANIAHVPDFFFTGMTTTDITLCRRPSPREGVSSVLYFFAGSVLSFGVSSFFQGVSDEVSNI